MRFEDATLRAAIDCMHSTAMQVLVPRKLYIMSSKTSFYPRTVISLLDANPRLAVLHICACGLHAKSLLQHVVHALSSAIGFAQ